MAVRCQIPAGRGDSEEPACCDSAFTDGRLMTTRISSGREAVGVNSTNGSGHAMEFLSAVKANTRVVTASPLHGSQKVLEGKSHVPETLQWQQAANCEYRPEFRLYDRFHGGSRQLLCQCQLA